MVGFFAGLTLLGLIVWGLWSVHPGLGIAAAAFLSLAFIAVWIE